MRVCLYSIPLLVPFALALEVRPLLASTVWLDREETTVAVVGTLALGLSSILLILLEMAIVKRTSALTTDVLGFVGMCRTASPLHCPLQGTVALALLLQV